jgi:hypothetical protein
LDLRRERDTLRVIPRRRAHDAAAFLLLGHQRELVQRTADLVRPDALKQLGLETDVVPGLLAQLARRQERRVLDVLGDARTRRLESRRT